MKKKKQVRSVIVFMILLLAGIFTQLFAQDNGIKKAEKPGQGVSQRSKTAKPVLAPETMPVSNGNATSNGVNNAQAAGANSHVQPGVKAIALDRDQPVNTNEQNQKVKPVNTTTSEK